MIEEFAKEREQFLRFRFKLNAIILGSYGVVGILSMVLAYWTSESSLLFATAFIVFLVGKHITEEAGVFKRARSGTFGTTEADALLWQQYVRFRDKKPGRFTNEDFD